MTPSTRNALAALASLAVALATLPAAAQVTIVGRDSQLAASWLAGYAGDVYRGGASDSDGNLMAIDGASLAGNDGANGFYAPTGNAWTATVAWDLSHQYTIEGSPSALDDATRILSSGHAGTTTSFTGLATVTVGANLPGNLLALSFLNPVEQQFLFEGGVAHQGPAQRNEATVTIVDDAGRPVAIGYTGSWQEILTLQPGLYTIEARAKSSASGIETAWASWNYSLEVVPAVPEPATAVLMLGGLAGLTWRRRRPRAMP